MAVEIERYSDRHREAVVELSLRAWAPVFPLLEQAVPSYVFRAFYPAGWERRQRGDIERFLRDEGDSVWVALEREAALGWIGVRLHAEDGMGEIHILAVDPDRQREGIATALIDAAFSHFRAAGMKIAMVETGDDPGHAPARATYRRNGFERWPVARFFREL